MINFIPLPSDPTVPLTVEQLRAVSAVLNVRPFVRDLAHAQKNSTNRIPTVYEAQHGSKKETA